MKCVILDGSAITSMAEVHRSLAEQLSFPEWYGGNLDALHDCLTELQEDVELRVVHSAALSEKLGPAYTRFCRVLSDSAEENPCLSLSL